ncbi:MULTISPECIES: hypothetical protein [unclassified Streptomyces]|uniref:hypothetical protein n=1 Tax=unclassified Streptomyces TaxID=2593676 RepID=UPI00380923DA
MSVIVTKTGGHSATITWTADDDPQGLIARSVEGDQLAYALEALGQPAPHGTLQQSKLAARHATSLAHLLERRAAAQVVRLRDVYELSWRQIAETVLDAREKQGSARRMYESGRRYLGIGN